jgi:hypothetical protein
MHKSRNQFGTIIKISINASNALSYRRTITGMILTYYYGFLFSSIVNSAIWFAISTIVNKYYCGIIHDLKTNFILYQNISLIGKKIK